MICPECGAKSQVVECRTDEEQGITLRRRRCPECDHVFYTKEKETSSANELFHELQKSYRLGRKHG